VLSTGIVLLGYAKRIACFSSHLLT